MTIPEPGEKVIKLFHAVYKTSPAYRDFIISHKVKAADIQTPADIPKIPIMDKHSYIAKYPLADRLYNGKKISDFYMASASSGSTGEPTFWLRDQQIDEHLSIKKEEMFEDSFGIKGKRTLCVVNLALGSWTGGMLTAKLAWAVAKNHHLTVVTPGVDKEATASIIKYLGGSYDQIIILGYPPFVLDLIEFLESQQLDLKKLHIKIMCTAERFSERWRNFIAEKISDNADRRNVVGFYACSDTGIVGRESEATIQILDMASKDSDLSEAFFGSSDTPSFFTYDPSVKYLETVNGEIIITADQPIPLIRYNIHDRGGLLSDDQLRQWEKQFNLKNFPPKLNSHYVYVYGRSDAVLLTANIYIEDIRYCLEKSVLHSKFSGYFQYGVQEQKNLKKRLVVHIYLKPGQKVTTAEKNLFEKEFLPLLLKVNTDLRVLKGVKISHPKIVFKPEPENKFKKTKFSYFLPYS